MTLLHHAPIDFYRNRQILRRWKTEDEIGIDLVDVCRQARHGNVKALEWWCRLEEGYVVTFADFVNAAANQMDWFDSNSEWPVSLCEVEEAVRVCESAAYGYHLTGCPHITFALLRPLLNLTGLHC